MKAETFGRLLSWLGAAVVTSVAAVVIGLLCLCLCHIFHGCQEMGARQADAMAEATRRGFGERTAEEIRADVERRIDGQMERGRATTGQLPAGQPAGGTPTPPSQGCQHVSDYGGE